MSEEVERWWRGDRVLWERQKDQAEAKMAEQIATLQRDFSALGPTLRGGAEALQKATDNTNRVAARMDRVGDRMEGLGVRFDEWKTAIEKRLDDNEASVKTLTNAHNQRIGGYGVAALIGSVIGGLSIILSAWAAIFFGIFHLKGGPG